MTVLT